MAALVRVRAPLERGASAQLGTWPGPMQTVAFIVRSQVWVVMSQPNNPQERSPGSTRSRREVLCVASPCCQACQVPTAHATSLVCHLKYDPLLCMNQNKRRYGWVVTIYVSHAVPRRTSLQSLTDATCRSARKRSRRAGTSLDVLKIHNHRPRSASILYPGFVDANPQYLAERNLYKWISPDGGETYNRCHLRSNFEVHLLVLSVFLLN